MITSPDSPHYSPVTRIILVTPPPVNTYQRGANLQSRDPPLLVDRSFKTTRKYAEAVVDVGRQENLPVVDVWNAVYDAAGRNERALDRFLEDGLHLNAAGYDVGYLISTRELHSLTYSSDSTQIMYDTLIDAIGNHYPEVHYDNLKSIFTP